MKPVLLAALKTKQLGRLCKTAAWVLLCCAFLQATLNAVYTWHTDSNPFGGSNFQFSSLPNIPVQFSPNYFALLPSLANFLAVFVFPLFLFVILYVGGSFLSALAASTAPTRDDTDDIVYESLKEPLKIGK